MYIIGLSGKSGHGKDYVARILFDMWGYYPLPFALIVKLDAISKFGATYEETFITKPPHTRQLLQKVGTESGRQFYGDGVWVTATLTVARWMEEMWGINKFCIPDVRFKNEMGVLQSNKHKVFHVIGDSTIQTKFGLTGEAARHASEVDLDDVTITTWDGVIINEYGKRDKVIDQLERLLTNKLKSKRSSNDD